MQPLPEDGFIIYSAGRAFPSLSEVPHKESHGGGVVQQNFIYILIFFLNKASRVSSEFLKRLRDVQAFKALLRERSHLSFHPGSFCSAESIPKLCFANKPTQTCLPRSPSRQPPTPAVPSAKTKSELTPQTSLYSQPIPQENNLAFPNRGQELKAARAVHSTLKPVGFLPLSLGPGFRAAPRALLPQRGCGCWGRQGCGGPDPTGVTTGHRGK